MSISTKTPQPRIAVPAPTGSSFDAIKQIDAGVLNVGYAEAGPPNGPPVVLLHGWPYDIHAFEEVAPILAAKGYRVIIPYLRGYGTTRFLSDATMRNGEQAAIAVDAIALMDALKIRKAIVGGFDWGSRTAGIMAALGFGTMPVLFIFGSASTAISTAMRDLMFRFVSLLVALMGLTGLWRVLAKLGYLPRFPLL